MTDFIKQIESFDDNAARVKTVAETIETGGLKTKRFVNEFWTAKQRQGHSLHEISYRACFKAELPRFFIERLTNKGDAVYDPFMGRGTTPLEAALLERIPLGNDVNPLSLILLEPRLSPPGLKQIEKRLNEIDFETAPPCEIDLSMFYSAKTLAQITALRAYLLEREKRGELDDSDKFIRMVATNRLTGHSNGFFSVYTLPPNQATYPKRQIEINRKRNQTPPDRDVRSIILKKSRQLLRDLTAADLVRLRSIAQKKFLLTGRADDSPEIKDGSVALIATSPPFLDVVQYGADNWLRCWFNGIDADAVKKRMTLLKDVGQWLDYMQTVFAELARVLKKGGHLAFEVGEVRGGRLALDELVAPLGEKTGLKLLGIIMNSQKFTKTSVCWGVSNMTKGTNANRIVLFKK